MITYVILAPGDIMLGTMRCAAAPTVEQLADELASLNGFPDRDALIHANPGLVLGFAILQ